MHWLKKLPRVVCGTALGALAGGRMGWRYEWNWSPCPGSTCPECGEELVPYTVEPDRRTAVALLTSLLSDDAGDDFAMLWSDVLELDEGGGGGGEGLEPVLLGALAVGMAVLEAVPRICEAAAEVGEPGWSPTPLEILSGFALSAETAVGEWELERDRDRELEL